MVDLKDVDGAVIVATVHYHGDGSTQRIWRITPEDAADLADWLGEPDAITLMDLDRMDAVDEAMSGVPMIVGGSE